jgi:transcriptional regulator GlxA family with amidase domain
VNRIRIGKACGMLYASDAPIMTISGRAGFQNIANFNRHFLKMKGMTPSEYREAARKDLFSQTEANS